MNSKINSYRSSRYRARGLSLLEVGAALTVATLVVAAGIVSYSGSTDNNGSDDALSELTAIRTRVGSFLTAQGDYTGLSTGLLASRGGLDSRWVNNGAMVNNFKGSVTVNPFSDLAYSVSYSGVPVSSCIRLLTTDYGPELSGISTNNGAVTISNKAAVLPAAAQAACKPKSSGTTDVTWIFGDPSATVGIPIAFNATAPVLTPAPLSPSAPTVPSGPGTTVKYSTPSPALPPNAPAVMAPPAPAPSAVATPSPKPVASVAPAPAPVATPAPIPAAIPASVPTVPDVPTAPVAPPVPNPLTRMNGFGAYTVHLLSDGTWSGTGYAVYQTLFNTGSGYFDGSSTYEYNSYYNFSGNLDSLTNSGNGCYTDACWNMSMSNFSYNLYQTPYPGDNVFDYTADEANHTLTTPSTANSTLLASGNMGSNSNLPNYMNFIHSNNLPNLTYGEWDQNFGGIGTNMNLTNAGENYFTPFTGGTQSSQIEALSYITSSGTTRQDDGNGGSYFTMGLYAATMYLMYPGDAGYIAP